MIVFEAAEKAVTRVFKELETEVSPTRPSRRRSRWPAVWPAPPKLPPAAAPLWPSGEDRRQISKLVRVERIIRECRQRKIPRAALAIAAGHPPGWFYNKWDRGRVDECRNWSDDELDQVERLLEDPYRAWPRDRRSAIALEKDRVRGRFARGHDPMH